MSMSVNGQLVTCNGEGCQARADVPIALRRMLGDDQAIEHISGWLFTARRGEWRHYCPDCLPLYLERLSEPSAAK